MGNRKRGKKQKKNNKYNKPLPPLAVDFKENLYMEALEGMSLLKMSKEELQAGLCKEGYIISKSWFDAWKTHVGYDQVVKNEMPSGRKYGRIELGQINMNIVQDVKLFHDVPSERFDFLTPPMKDLQPGKDFIIITEALWKFFYDKYGGIPIKRHADDKGEFKLKMINPTVIFLNNIDQIQSLNANALKKDNIDMKRLTVLAYWSTSELQNYISEFMNYKQIWIANPLIDQTQLAVILLKSIHKAAYQIKGKLITDGPNISHLIKNNHTLIVTNQIFEQEDYKFDLNTSGVCFECNQKTLLTKQCGCLQAFYCGDKCRYSDQDFHSLSCDKAFDSDDDFELDQVQQLEGVGVGLENMGNTCYMNSCLQSLFSSSQFQQYLINKKYQQNQLKKQIQLNYKLEKLMKHLFQEQRKFCPWSFRQQLAKKYPVFGGNFQQDAAEFLLYLFDALNEELIVKQEVQVNQLIADTEQKCQSDSDEADDDENEDDQQDEEETQVVAQKQKIKSQKIHDDSQKAWEDISKNMSSLMVDNFIGLLQSTIHCPICDTQTQNYEAFNILPLSLDIVRHSYKVEVTIIFQDWFTPHCKETVKYIPEGTMLADLKREVGERVGIDPCKLMAAVSNSYQLHQYLFYDEDYVSKILKENDGMYITFFEMDRQLVSVTDDDQYFDIQITQNEKKNQYSCQTEILPASIPRLILVDKKSTSAQIYQKIFFHLGNHAHADQIMQIIPEEAQENDILTEELLDQILPYKILIGTKIPSKSKCPFTCGRYFKKEQKNHECTLPLNNKSTLVDYLDKIYYTNSHTSIVIEFKESKTPQEIVQKFDQLPKQTQQIQRLDDLIEQFQTSESLCGENAYYCQKCNDLTFADKQMRLHSLPNQLIIQLKRFHFNQVKGSFSKNTQQVEFPLNININEINYSLYGVVQHFGGLDNGHYIALGLRNEQWYEFNDDKVHQIKEQEVVNNKHAYLLLYQKKTN